MTTPAVAGFDQAPFIHQGRTHPVYRAGAGPAVVVIHEIPGIHPAMVSFAQRLLGAGYTVYLPSLFGWAGQPVGTGTVLGSILQVCVCEPRVRHPGRPDQPGRDLAAGPPWRPTLTVSAVVLGWARSACV